MTRSDLQTATAAARCVELLAVDVDGTLTDAGVYYGPDGEALKRFSIHDGMGLEMVRKAGVAVAILTSENSPIVSARAAKLKIEDVFLGVRDKVACLDSLRTTHGLTWQQVAFVGDDINDHAVLRKAGFSACPADAPEKTHACVDYLCRRGGGRGAVREVCEFIIAAKEADVQWDPSAAPGA